MPGPPSTYKPEYAPIAEKLCSTFGATLEELALYFEVSERTIKNWGNRFPEFMNAIKVGREPADERVKMSLYRKAMGYTYKVEEVFFRRNEVIRVETEKHIPPSDAAAIFWMKARCGWTDRPQEEDPENGNTLVIKHSPDAD